MTQQPTGQEPELRCLHINSCFDCSHRCEMKELYKPYGMQILPPSKEISDFSNRWVCTENDDMEITQTSGFPDWCPLPRSRPYSPAPLISHSECYKTGYAEGAQSERENVLDEISQYVKESRYFGKHFMNIMIESLRAGKEG